MPIQKLLKQLGVMLFAITATGCYLFCRSTIVSTSVFVVLFARNLANMSHSLKHLRLLGLVERNVDSIDSSRTRLIYTECVQTHCEICLEYDAPSIKFPYVWNLIDGAVRGNAVSMRMEYSLRFAHIRRNEVSLLKNALWSTTIRPYKELAQDSSSLLIIPSLNSMFDMAATRDFARHNHAPKLIFAILSFLTIICSFFVGYNLAGGKRVYWLHGTIFATVIVGMFFVIIDFEYLRLGAISMRIYNKPLIDLRKAMD